MNIHTIAFYNTENLFDVYGDDATNDYDFVPLSSKKWTIQRYQRKINQLGFVISKIGLDSAQKPPVLIGLAEVENDSVLHDLTQSRDLKPHNYGFVHYNSMDERGIDVALLYKKDEFTVETSKAFPVFITEESGKRDLTRDILLVTGFLNGTKIHVLVNHWPSRHEGRDETEFKRQIAAAQLSEIIFDLKSDDRQRQIIVIGDFNDNPNNHSIINIIKTNELHNAMESMWSYSRGSVNHNFSWILFDQIFVSQNFINDSDVPLKLFKADIFDEKFLTQYDGKFKGQPYRTYIGKNYKGGFSDHFPVYIQLKDINK